MILPALVPYRLSVASFTNGVGHPVKSLAYVRRTDARRREIDRPDGVAIRFQVSRYKIEPHPSVWAFNLFPKDDARATLAEEPVPSRPEVPLVSKPAAFACLAERLAWAGSGPDRPIVGPAGPAEREAPKPDAGEEMALGVASQIVGADVPDVPCIDVSGSNQSICDEGAQPFRRKRIALIIVGAAHIRASS
jgi:hypothetical protein